MENNYNSIFCSDWTCRKSHIHHVDYCGVCSIRQLRKSFTHNLHQLLIVPDRQIDATFTILDRLIHNTFHIIFIIDRNTNSDLFSSPMVFRSSVDGLRQYWRYTIYSEELGLSRQKVVGNFWDRTCHTDPDDNSNICSKFSFIKP